MSVHKNTTTGKWFVRFRTPDGKNRQKTFTQKKDAERFDREQRMAIERGTWTDPSGAKLKVSELFEQYETTKLGLKQKSISSNNSLWSYHLAPKFGNTSIGAINIRVRPEERALIDHAAMLSGKSRSEFMLEAARRAANDAILDRTLLRLEPAAFARFVAMLDAPPQPNEKLRKLLGTTPPWG